jgi:hypothetical protein
LSDELAASTRERVRALIVVAVIVGSATLAASLMLHTTEGTALAVVLLVLTAIAGFLAWRWHRI